jgi:GGDEF domain-containing protein
MGEQPELVIRLSHEGEIVIFYPDGSRDQTGIYPSESDQKLIETMNASTAARSLFMRMRRREYFDDLTGLLLRAPAKATIARQLERWSQKKFDGLISVLVLDLDHFGLVNKTHGQSAGDNVLRWFAQILRDKTRGNDILARWGGEEFVVVAAANKPSSEAAKREQDGGHASDSGLFGTGTSQDIGKLFLNGRIIATRICEATRSTLCNVGSASIKQTVTIGVASWYLTPEQSVDGVFEILFERADEQLRQAKTGNQRDGIHEAQRLFQRPTDS